MTSFEVSLKQANYFTLSRHYLIDKTNSKNILKVIHELSGLQAQSLKLATMQLGVRLKNFKKEQLNDLLFRKKFLVRTWLMRGTLHIVTVEDYPIFYQASKFSWLQWWESNLKNNNWHSIEDRQRLLHPHIIEILNDGKEHRRNELKAQLLQHKTSLKKEELGVYHLTKESAYMGILILGPQRANEQTYVGTAKWFPALNLNKISESSAISTMFIQYLSTYGPATLKDFRFFSGIPAIALKNLPDTVSDEVINVKIEGFKDSYFILKNDLKTLGSVDEDVEIPPIIVPDLDPVLLGNFNRRRFMDESNRKKSLSISSPWGSPPASILTDGVIKAVWTHKLKGKKETYKIHPLEKIDKNDMEIVKAKIEDLLRLEAT